MSRGPFFQGWHRSPVHIEHECGWTEFLETTGIDPSEDTGCIFKKCASTCKEDKMTTTRTT